MRAILYDDGTLYELPDSVSISISGKEIIETFIEKDDKKYKEKLKSLTDKSKSIKSK